MGTLMFGGAVLLAYRKIRYDPELKLDARSRQSPIMDNKEKALQFQAHREYFGKFDTYIKRPEAATLKPAEVKIIDGDNEQPDLNVMAEPAAATISASEAEELPEAAPIVSETIQEEGNEDK